MPNTRELSQLASLINVNDETKSIRVLVDQPDAKIGVGTENPIARVDVSGDVNVSGAVTATSFYGDGSNLSNIISGVGIQSGGVIIGTAITTLNFIGIGNTFAVNGTTVDISIAIDDVGIGSTGSINTSGIITATSFFGDGSGLTNLSSGGVGIGSTGSINTSGIITATSFFGDGSGLTGISSVPAKTSGSFTATEGQTVFSYSYKPEFIDVFLNGIRLNEIEFTASNGTSITLITPASVNDVLDVVEYTMGTGPQGPEGAGGPLNNVTVSTSSSTHYPLFTLGAGSTLPFIATELNYFKFTPSTGTLNVNQLSVTGVVTASAFVGDGSGLTGAGSTVADDTSTDETFYPILTQQTSGTVTASKISTTKLTFNPSTGTLNATELNATSDINLKENIRTLENPIEKVMQLNGVSFDWKESQESSMGVIAQELEKVFPELVRTGDIKSVNYNGLIGVLIEGMKAQQEQINNLKEEIQLLKES